MIYLIHAFPLGPSMYSSLIEQLDQPAKALTLAGFAGRPLPTSEPSLETFARDIVSQIEAGPIVLAGCSLGGYIVMEILRQQLLDPDAIILMDTKHTADTPEAVTNRIAIAERAEMGEVNVDSLSAPLLGSQSGQLVPDVQELVRMAPGATIGWTQRAMAKRPDSSGVLNAFTKPALVIVGEEDALAPVEVATQMAGLFSKGQLVAIKNAGHLAPMEQPTKVADAINSFLREV